MATKKLNPKSTRYTQERLTGIKLLAATHGISQNEAINLITDLGLGKPVTIVKVESKAGDPQQLNQLAGLLIDSARSQKLALSALRDPHVIHKDDNESLEKEKSYIARLETHFDENLRVATLVRSTAEALLHMNAERVARLRKSKAVMIAREKHQRELAESTADEKQKATARNFAEMYRDFIELVSWFGI